MESAHQSGWLRTVFASITFVKDPVIFLKLGEVRSQLDHSLSEL